MATEGNNIRGNVFVQFIVLNDGSITDVEIVRSLCKACDDEARRLVEEMPKWNPATEKGKPVIKKLVLPIRFGLTNPYE